MATNNVLNHTSDFLSMPAPTDTGVGAVQADGKAILTTYNYNVIVGPTLISELPPLVGTDNVIIGAEDTGQNLTSGTFNVAIGSSTLQSETTGSFNIAIGGSALGESNGASNNIAIGPQALGGSSLAGTYCIGIGNQAGSAYNGVESYNIILGATAGSGSETNVMRLGSDGSVLGGSETLATYIYGIDGVNVGSVATVVTEASNQLGSAVLTAGSGISITPTANTITIAATGAATKAAFNAYLSTATSNDVTGDGTGYQVIFDTALFDTTSSYNTGTGVFTAPADGIYMFTVAIMAQNLGSQNTLQLQINTATNSFQGAYCDPANGNSSNFFQNNMAVVLSLSMGDTVSASIVVAGGTKTVGIDGGGPLPGQQFTYFSCAQIA